MSSVGSTSDNVAPTVADANVSPKSLQTNGEDAVHLTGLQRTVDENSTVGSAALKRRVSIVTLGGRLNEKAVAYAATSLGASLIDTVYNFYYVKVFLNRYHVTGTWFQIAQIIFMVWNALNDPIVACLQDNARSIAILRSRRHSILYGAPLFVLSFLFPWFPWTNYESESPDWIAGLQLLASLCFYDALFTFVLLAQCALTAELTADHSERVQFIRYSQVASLIGSTSVFISEAVSSSLEDYFAFQMTCIGLGVLAGLCFVYTGLNAATKFDRRGRNKKPSTDFSAGHYHHQQPVSENGQREDRCTSSSSVFEVLRQSKEIITHRNFICFVLVNLCQIFHMKFLANFANIIGDRLIGDQAMPPAMKRVIFGSLFLLPNAVVFAGASVVASVGYFRVIRCGFVLKIVTGLVFLVAGHDNGRFVAVFYLIECINVSGTFSLFNLCLSDVIDSDLLNHSRSHPLSSMVFGLNALITKPSISLAPMVTVAILNAYGYSDVQRKASEPAAAAEVTVGTLELTTASPAGGESEFLTSAMFTMSCLVPICIGILQLVVWNFYTFRDSHKKSIRDDTNDDGMEPVHDTQL